MPDEARISDHADTHRVRLVDYIASLGLSGTVTVTRQGYDDRDEIWLFLEMPHPTRPDEAFRVRCQLSHWDILTDESLDAREVILAAYVELADRLAVMDREACGLVPTRRIMLDEG